VRAIPLAGLLLALTGCLSVDPVIYGAVRADRYALSPEGSSPEETVSADRIEPVSIVVSDQVTLGAAYLKASVQPPQAYVIFFHGRSGNLDNHFGRAKRWSNLGYDVLVFDYRGFGTSSDVAPTEPGILEDTRAVRAWMLGRIGASNAARLVYYGQSLGGATSTQLAEQVPPAALVLESTFSSIRDFEVDTTDMDFPVGFISHCTWNTAERVRNVHVPVLVVHGLVDETIKAEFGQKVFASANEPKKLVLVPGAGHGNVAQTMGPEQYKQLMNDFIGFAVGP
jgi:uncharacterized protein